MLQLHRLANLSCKFFILLLNLSQPAYKVTHHLYIPKHEVSFSVQERFLIRLSRLILNRFCSVFQFRLYIQGVPKVDIYFFVGFCTKIVSLKQKLPKYGVVNVIGNWSSAISLTMPRNILFPQHMF